MSTVFNQEDFIMPWQQRTNRISTAFTDEQLQMIKEDMIRLNIASRAEWLYRVALRRIDPSEASDPAPVKTGRPPLNRAP